MNDNDCKHEKITSEQLEECDNYLILQQTCQICKAFRGRYIFTYRSPGLTVCSENVDPWRKL